MATQLATISDQKAALEKWTPLYLFDVTLKDGVPRFWAKQALTFGGNAYAAIVLEHSVFKQEGNGVYGVDAVTEIGLTLNNADANLNALLAPNVWRGGIIQPRFIFVAPDGVTTTDSIVYPKFLIDFPTATWPKVEFAAHNRWNLGRKMLPVSLLTRKDRYPFPDTDAERAAAGSDPTSPFFAIGYDPATGKGNWKTAPSTPYRRFDYDGTREKLREIGLEVRFGGFGKAPPTVVGTPSKGQKADYVGNANEAKYGQAVPLIFGICRIQPIVLDTGFPSGEGGWNGSRLSHYLLSDGVNFAPEHINGIEDVLDVFIPDNKKYQRIPETSNKPDNTGAWSFQGGYYGSQKAPTSSKYRNIDQAIDFPQPDADFTNRDLYSGLAYLEIGFPKELSGEDGIGPKIEAIVKGLKLQWWDADANTDWMWTDNPVWIFVHLLKLLRWSVSELDIPSLAAAAAYCDEIVPSGKKRFRCNLPLMQQTRAADVLRGVRNNCRMYTTFAADGKLQLKIAQNVAGEGGLAFNLDNTNIMRGDDGQLQVEKFHRSIYEIANVFSATFQNEDNLYNSDSYIKVDVGNINQIDERISADSIFPILGLPSFDQAERQMEWARQEQVLLNEYYRVTCSLSLIEAKVGQIGTITEARHGLISQQVRIRAMAPGPDTGTIELILQKHSDGAYTDNAVETPFTRAQADSSYTPRSVGGKLASSPSPILTEITVADPINADTSVRRIRVEFKPPARDYEGSFSRATKISDVVVATSGGSIPGGQVLFVEVAPVKAAARGLASEYLMAVIPSGGNSNIISFTCELPPEATHYIAFVGNFPGQTYETLVEPSPGTAPFTISITALFRNFGSIPPDPAYDHAQIFYKYNSSPNVLRDGGRTFAPDEGLIEFEPEAPAAEDTQVTVYVSSANAAEDDFYPIEISPKALLTLTYENGPAKDWTATLLPGPTPSSVVPKFTRPKINGKRLFWIAGQIKDSGTGEWRRLDENAGAAVTYYDGSNISHESIGGLKIKKDPGQPLGFGTAKIDDLIMLDVAGGSFDPDRCQWATLETFLDDLGNPTTVGNARYLAISGGLFRPQTTQDLRMKIIKPPHTWIGEGYLGDLSNESINGGVFWEWVGDREGDEFTLKPVEIGRDIASVDVRFWLENDYCRSSGIAAASPKGVVSLNMVRVRAAMDFVIPGPVQSLVVTGGNGEFVAKWNDPLTGAATIDDVAIQWATDAAFTAIIGTAAGWGDVNRLSGTDPGKTYFWRLAAHNLSDQPSDPSTVSLGATGWGPWTAYGAPTAVSSGLVPGSGGPVDTVLPGFLQNLQVSGANGNYVASWLDPATGYATIDDHAVQYATNPGFTIGVNTSKGYGDVNRVDSTSPGTTYYFRFAAHNQSGLTSDSSTFTQLGPTGWGPWTQYGAPTAVPSGGVPGAPIDSVIPGPVQNLTVTGGAGEFVATWIDPATGNMTIDDVAIQYATNSTFTANVTTSPGWGPVTRLKGTDPEKTYYFRIAVHNQSNQPSDSSTAATLGATGWGPWTAYGAPTVVSSGTIPGGGYQSTDDNLCPNGSFEIDTDSNGLPDYCTYPADGIAVAGAGRITGGLHGTYAYKVPANGTSAISLGGFPVQAADVLAISCYAAPSTNSTVPGFFVRAAFHPTDRQFITPSSSVDVVSGIIMPAGWNKYEGRVTVPAGMNWCRILLYNWGDTVDYFYDNVVVKRITTGSDIKDNTIPPARFTGSARSDFVETFDQPLLAPPWTITQNGVVSYPTSGIDGGKVFRVDGSKQLYSFDIKIPFDPRKLYRLSCRIRTFGLVAPANSQIYLGLVLMNNQGVQLPNRYVAANAFQPYGVWAVGQWQVMTGWFKGHGTNFIEPAPDAANPCNLDAGTSYISPVIALGWPPEAPVGNNYEIDDYRIESFDEQIYESNAPNGTFSNLTKLVEYPYPDAASTTNSKVTLMWDYTQGLVKAQQFAIYISDGTAAWVERIQALAGTGLLRHRFVVYRLLYNRPVTITVTAEAVEYGGQVAGVSASFGTFTPNAPSGSDIGGTLIGSVDWAGGDIWFESYQYRNGIAPSNGCPNSISIEYFHTGSGASAALISNIGYTQGSYLATHLAVVLRGDTGSITNLYQEMVVTYLSAANLPSNYRVPISLPDNRSFTVTIAAVAETAKGRIFNSTFYPVSRTQGPVKIEAIEGPTNFQYVALCNPDNPDEFVNLYRPMRMQSPYANVSSYNGAIYQGAISGDGNGMYLVNSSNRGIQVTQGSTPNFAFGISNYFGNATGALAITDGAGWGAGNPIGGGLLLSYGGAGYWVTSNGNLRNFAPAGPHCGKCGYDFWLIAVENKERKSSLHICGWCGEVYKKGPKKILDSLTEQERSELIYREGKNDKNHGPAKARLRRRSTRRKRPTGQSRLRRARSRKLRHG